MPPRVVRTPSDANTASGDTPRAVEDLACPRFRHRRSGFTLLEIVLVVAIIAVLVTLAAPTFQKPRSAAQQAAVKLELLDLMAAQRLYHLRHQTFTQTLDDLPDATARHAGEHGYTFEARACPPNLKHCVRLVANPPTSDNGEPLTLDSNGHSNSVW